MKKIETIAEYQQLASRTCPDLGNPELNIRHMHMGIITEVAETLDVIKKNLAYKKPFDIVNTGEEIADTIWYKANENRMFDIKLWTTEEFEILVNEWNNLLIDDNISLDENTVDELLTVILPTSYKYYDSKHNIQSVVVLKYIAEYFKLDFYQILTNNIAKLQVRYPDKFTNEDALNRDLKAERIELEK